MRKSLFLTALFVLSVLSPIASADVTETQFQDGSTSYTHTFSGTGDGFAGNLTFPYGHLLLPGVILPLLLILEGKAALLGSEPHLALHMEVVLTCMSTMGM